MTKFGVRLNSLAFTMVKAVTAFLVVASLVASVTPVNALRTDPGVVANPVSSSYTPFQADAYSIGVQAYIYGLAPVIMQRTEEEFTATPGPGHAPVNQFGHVDHLATPDDRVIVTPNADTLYSSAWLELGNGPVVLHVPDTGGRYYVMQMLDAYTNTFDYVGRRTTGTQEGNFAIVGPGWDGDIPAGVNVILAPTNTVWIVGRILVDGEDDLPDAAALQKQFTLTSLSQYNNSSSTPVTAVNKAMPSSDAQERLKFYEELRVALKNNPPPEGEEALMAIFDRIGLGNDTTPFGSDMQPEIADGLAKALIDGKQIVNATWAKLRLNEVNGWAYPLNIGTYDFDYLTRAAVAEGGLAANVPEEAVYLKAQADGGGNPLSGSYNYVIHFDSGNLPPVDAFWSLTAYNAADYMLVNNSINRYAIGDRTQGLSYNPDGSLDVYIQHSPPAGGESNWLPAPEGDFYLILRMYQPKQEVLNSTYQVPPVQKVS